MEDLHKDDEVISLKQIIINYLLHWKLFVLAAFISIIPALFYLILYPKTYEIKALVRVQDEKSLNNGGGINMGDAAGLMRSFGLNGGNSGSINIDDEMARLQSVDLLSKVVYRLNLDVKYEKPFSFETYYTEVPIIVRPDSLMRHTLEESVMFKLKVDSSGKGRIIMDESGEVYNFSTLPAHLDLEVGSFDILPNSDTLESVSINVTIRPSSWVAEDLADEISYDTYSESGNTIELSIQDHNKYRGKDILNTLVSIYNETEIQVKKKDGDKANLFLTNRINGVLQELENVERSIELYKLKNKMTDVEYDVQFYSEALKTYREKLIEFETQNHMIDLLYNYVIDPANSYKLIPPMFSAGGNNSGDNSSPISSYNEAIIKWEKTKKTSKGDNPLAEVSIQQIDKLRESVLISIKNTKDGLQIMTNELKDQEKNIIEKMGNVPTYEREYLDLKRQQEILQGVYLVLLQKKEEVALSVEGGREKGFSVDEAYAKYLPIAPRKLYAAIFMVLFTVIIPVAYLFCKDQLLSLKKEYLKIKKKQCH